MTTSSPDQSSVLEQSSKFTPGPWFVGSWNGQCHLPHKHDGKSCKYDFEKLSGPFWDHYVSCGTAENPGTLIGADEGGPVLNKIEDARLIAAAPELLMALSWLLGMFEKPAPKGRDDYEDQLMLALAGARAAIAKATGGA